MSLYKCLGNRAAMIEDTYDLKLMRGPGPSLKVHYGRNKRTDGQTNGGEIKKRIHLVRKRSAVN